MNSLTVTKTMLLSASVAMLLVSVAQADPRATRDKKGRVVDQIEEERYVVVTGSHIPQKVKVKPIGTATPYNVRVYSRDELDRSGRSTVAGALRVLDPSIRVSGR